MKILLILIIFIQHVSLASANERQTNNLYTSVTLLYWCTYKEMPTGNEDILKISDIFSTESELSIGFDDWINSVSYEIKGNELVIINSSKTISSHKYQTSTISRSSTNCDDYFKRQKKRKELEKKFRQLPKPTNNSQETIPEDGNP